MLPSGKNTASRLLSETANDINKKKVHVNAQVTATTTFLESSYGILYAIVFGYVSKGSSFGTLIQGMGLQCVLLPYTFLMNTAHNKNRIVEIGWKNVVKNIFGMKNNSVSTSNCNSSKPNTSGSNISKDTNSISKTITGISKHTFK